MDTNVVIIPRAEYDELMLTLNTLFTLERNTWSNPHTISLTFNKRALLKLALRRLNQEFSREELDQLDITPLDKLYISDPSIATVRTPE